MESLVTANELILFHQTECQLFNYLTGRLRKPALLTKLVIALWLVLEEMGFYNLIEKASSRGDSTMEAIFDETVSCLSCMDPINTTEPPSTKGTPFLAQITNNLLNRRFIYFNRNFVLNRVSRIMKSVCDVIFNENATKEAEGRLVHPVVRASGEGSSTQGAMRDFNQTPTHSSSTLNPSAKKFTMGEKSTSQYERSLFLTFSNGHPLSREEIIHFFTSEWGPVVENVIIDQKTHYKIPQYGRIIFTNISVIRSILKGQWKVKFIVNGKHLWARVYMSKRK
ncbi:hypothetical protein BVC80_1513g17 [Macleaya cordata]|uniref:Uncharacterized protein n=1 Tax=Macleaya cordata TaxID=56857 RepID=A0A200PTH1_MACCD|nr:hypothetical protein BVC80_1513g17 [Macleaya cordata]